MVDYSWLGEPDNIEDYQAFVYVIKNKIDGRFYIGSKQFWKIDKLPPLKGRTKKEKERRSKLKNTQRRHVKKQTNWKRYCGSSDALKEDVENLGIENFERRILRCCKTRGEAAYFELKYQMIEDVLLREDSYNNIVNVRLNGNIFKKVDMTDDYQRQF